MVFAAHDDRFLRTGVHTESAVDASHHVDVETEGVFFDLRVWMFARFDVDALRRADRRAHVTRDALQASVTPNRQDVGASKPFRVRATLFRVVDGWSVALEQTHE